MTLTLAGCCLSVKKEEAIGQKIKKPGGKGERKWEEKARRREDRWKEGKGRKEWEIKRQRASGLEEQLYKEGSVLTESRNFSCKTRTEN